MKTIFSPGKLLRVTARYSPHQRADPSKPHVRDGGRSRLQGQPRTTSASR